MMIRALLLLLVSASLVVRASDPIGAKYFGASTTVTQPHVTAELIPESAGAQPGKPFAVILHLHSDPGWHTYWINPGDAGLATTIKWTLPPGFTAGPIQWPTPEKHKMGPLVTYGYEGDVYLIATITPPSHFEGEEFRSIEIKARANWLVCQEECIPGKGDFSINVIYWNGLMPLHNTVVLEENKALFQAARVRLPVPNKGWDVSGTYAVPPGKTKEALEITIKNKGGRSEKDMGNLQFFPEQSNVLDAQMAATTIFPPETPSEFDLWLALQQNGEKPDQISGILVSDVALVSEKTGDSHAVYILAFPVSKVVAAVPSGGSATVSATNGLPPVAVGDPDNKLSGPPEGGADDGHRPLLQAAPPMGTSAATSEAEAAGTHRVPDQGEGGMMAASTAREAQPWLIAVLGAAFVGGVILNLMPCVLPVLSLKVFSMMKHAEHDHSKVWKQGVAFTVGVVISFWLLAGLLLFLRAAGNQLGWGFQMQSPGFVLALIFIFFLLGLNLFGVFELGTSLVGLDAKVTGRHNHGLFTSFLNGALATLAATPCTAPFMGSALGFAAQQSAAISLLIFTFLALGMAAPYLLLTIFPHALKFVPKPGAWMEAFKQFMGFLLMATVIFLIYVFGALVGEGQIPWLLAALLIFALFAWGYGRWGTARWFRISAIILGVYAVLNYDSIAIAILGEGGTVARRSTATTEDGWQPWSQDAVGQALAQGKPVFVDFTAAWCLSCKVNERVALDTDAVRKAFSDKNVVLFKADWTHADPAISEALRKYNRDGVPLYLLYSPKDPTKPQVLPEVLTPGIVLDALGKV